MSCAGLGSLALSPPSCLSPTRPLQSSAFVNGAARAARGARRSPARAHSARRNCPRQAHASGRARSAEPVARDPAGSRRRAGPAKPIPRRCRNRVPRDGADIALVLPLQSPRLCARGRGGARRLSRRRRSRGRGTARARHRARRRQRRSAAFEGAKSTGRARRRRPAGARRPSRAGCRATAPLPLTLALNQLDEGAALPPQVYTLALAVESDARVLARRMRADNVQNVDRDRRRRAADEAFRQRVRRRVVAGRAAAPPRGFALRRLG